MSGDRLKSWQLPQRILLTALLIAAAAAFGVDPPLLLAQDSTRGTAATTPLRLPIARPSGVPFAQIFDNKIANRSDLVGKRWFVYGATVPVIGQGAYTTFYYPMYRDLNRQHSLEWYKSNHPEWVVYKCDQTTPAYGFTYDWGANVPIDVSNPAVREYMLQTFFVPAIRKGYPAIGLDNWILGNWLGACGIWRGGQWVQLFPGTAWDLKYAQDGLAYIKWLRNELHNRGTALAANLGVDPNHVDYTEQALNLLDILVDERGWGGCKWVTDENLRLRVPIINSYAQQHPYVSISQSCHSLAEVKDDELSWDVANFLLVRGPRSYLAITGHQEYGIIADARLPPLDVGAPTGELVEKEGIFTRTYERALVLVNPSSKAAVPLELPNGQFKSAWGPVFQGRIVLGPASGLVLYRQ